MKLTEFIPMLWTEDITASFYYNLRIIGFTGDEISEEWGWASLSKDNVDLMVAGPSERTPYEKIGFTGSFYINTDDVDGLWRDLKDKAKVCYRIEDLHYRMREFAVYDNNGYRLQFGQLIEKR